jgi:hypothetical protein
MIQKNSLQKISPFYEENFCDSMHKTSHGQELAAQCFIEQYKPVLIKDEILAVGGSTTSGHDCNDVNMTWTDIISKNLKVNVINKGKSGSPSVYGINKIRELLAMGSCPKSVLWAYWTNEILTEKNMNIDFKNDNIRYLFFKISYPLFVIERTIFQWSYIYRALHFYLAKFDLLNRYGRFFTNSFEDPDTESDDQRLDFKANLYMLKSMLSPESRKRGRESLIEKLNELKQLSLEYNLKIYCVKMPYVKDYLKISSPAFNDAFNNWFVEISEELEKQCNHHQFEIIDIQKCFEQKRLGLK